MTFIVTENCINCKYQDCVNVCPVDCFYEGENFLVIHPDECIDCGVCEPECPADAIKADTQAGLEDWLAVNRKYSEIWPNITEAGSVPPDADDWNGKPDKAVLLITGEGPERPTLQKPVCIPLGENPAIDGATYEIDGARLAVREAADENKTRLEPRKPVACERPEIEGLRMPTDSASRETGKIRRSR